MMRSFLMSGTLGTSFHLMLFQISFLRKPTLQLRLVWTFVRRALDLNICGRREGSRIDQTEDLSWLQSQPRPQIIPQKALDRDDLSELSCFGARGTILRALIKELLNSGYRPKGGVT